ncbi:MAG: Rpp14/Pop5 family protein [Nanoarchaeota archaeon]
MIKIGNIKLSPTLREKKRYVVYEIVSGKKFMLNEVKTTVNNANQKFLGELGMARAGIIHIDNLYKNNKGILKVSNKYVNELKLSLALIKSINNDKVIFNTIYTSGILKKAQKHM